MKADLRPTSVLPPLLLALIVLPPAATTRGEDLIDTRQLGERGAILETWPETPRSRTWQGQLDDVVDLGDVNGDGLHAWESSTGTLK
jgi:hypothetical protein